MAQPHAPSAGAGSGAGAGGDAAILNTAARLRGHPDYVLDKAKRRAPTAFASRPQHLTDMVVVGYNIGIDAVHEAEDVWMIEERMAAPLPPPWVECYDAEGTKYYHCDGHSTWDNPLDEIFRLEVERWREQDAKQRKIVREDKARKAAARQNRERARARQRARKGWPPKTPMNPVSSREKIMKARQSMRRLVGGLGKSAKALGSFTKSKSIEAEAGAVGEGGTGPLAKEVTPHPEWRWDAPVYTPEQLIHLVRELGIDAAKHPALLSNVPRYVDLSLDSPTPGGWVKHTDGSGVTYYHEPDTGDRTYLHPQARIIRQQIVQVRSLPSATRGLLSDRWFAIADKPQTSVLYVHVATGQVRAGPPDLSHESATHIQRMMRGRIGRQRAMKIREIQMKKTPAQRLLEAERRFAEQLKREEDAKAQANRRGMAAAEAEQLASGDKFWGKQIVEAELHRVASNVRMRKMEVAAKMARDAERAIRLAEELKSREALALQLRRELDRIAQGRRKVELEALRSMRAEEARQVAKGDRFWGVDAYLRNLAKGEEYEREMMRVEDARSRSIRDTEKFTRWAALAAERRTAMEAYRDQAEDEARHDYLSAFWHVPMSTAIMEYEWPTRADAAVAARDSFMHMQAAAPGSASESGSRSYTGRGTHSGVFALSASGSELGAEPRAERAYGGTGLPGGSPPPLHARTRVFHSLNRVRSHGKRAPLAIVQDAKSAYKRPPRGQSTRAGGSPRELAKQHALHTPGAGMAFHLKGLGGHPSNRTSRRKSEPGTGRGRRRPQSSGGHLARSASAAAGATRNRVQSAGARRRGANSAPASPNAWGPARPAVDVDLNPDGGALFGSHSGVDMRFGVTPMAQRRSVRTPASAPATRANSPQGGAVVASGDGWVPVPPMGELSAISAASEHGFTPPADGSACDGADVPPQQVSPRSGDGSAQVQEAGSGGDGGDGGEGGGDVITDPRFRAPRAQGVREPPMSPMTNGRHGRRRSGASRGSRGSRASSTRQRQGRYGERGKRKPLTNYSLSYIFKHLTKPRVDSRRPSTAASRRSAARASSGTGVSAVRGLRQGRPATAPARSAKRRALARGRTGKRPSTASSTGMSQIMVGREPAMIKGDPYQLLLQPTHQPSAAFIAASPNFHAHSHNHLTNASEDLWPVPDEGVRTTRSVQPRGYVLVAVSREKIERAMQRKAQKRGGQSRPSTPGADGAALYMRRLYCAVWGGAVLYMFRDEAECRDFFKGKRSANTACGYIDLEGVVQMQRTEVAIPGRSPRKSTGGGVDGGGGGPETEAGASGGSADGDGGASGGEAGPAGDPSVGEAAVDASAGRRGGDARAGDQAQGGRGGDGNDDDDELPATFQGIELTTPHQSWTFFPDWRPLREVLVKEVSAMAESATESTRLAAEKAQEVVVRTEQVRRAKRKGPVEGNHKMQMQLEASKAQAEMYERRGRQASEQLAALDEQLRSVEHHACNLWWDPMVAACSRRNERLKAVTADPGLDVDPTVVDASALSVKSWLVPAREMELVSALQRQDVAQLAHVAAAGEGGKPHQSLNRGRVLEVKGNGSYGYIRPEELGGDLEVYFRMEDADSHLHVNDNVTYDAVRDTRSAKSGDQRAVRIKLLARSRYTTASAWSHAFVAKVKLPPAVRINVSAPRHPRPSTAGTRGTQHSQATQQTQQTQQTQGSRQSAW